MSKKALFYDIDGTLLSEVTHEVPESAKRALKEARARGHMVFINSGRPYCHIGPIREEIEVDGYLCGCGTCIIVDDEILYSHHIPHELGVKIKKSLIKHDMDGVLEGTEACYFHNWGHRMEEMHRLRKALGRTGCISPYGWDVDCYEFDKMCVLADEKSDRAGFFRDLGLEIDVIDRGNNLYECVSAGHSKATAIEFILEKYGIPLEDAYVFGDSTNDLSMFEYAKNAVLMGHHDRELEPYATFLTKNVEDDGIEYAMKKLKIID